MKAAAASAGIHSMTGFAQARIEQDGWSLRINLRSVNHRFLDLHLRMPDGFEVFESRIRLAIRNRLRRGHVDVNVYYEPAGPASVEVNRGVAEAYMKAVEELRGQFGVKTEPDLIALFRLPGVVAAPGLTRELQSEETQERLGAQLEACLAQALGRLETMRRSEGQTLTEEMQGLLARIAEQTAEIESLSQRVRPAFARRLEAKLTELLSGDDLSAGLLAAGARRSRMAARAPGAVPPAPGEEQQPRGGGRSRAALWAAACLACIVAIAAAVPAAPPTTPAATSPGQKPLLYWW